MYGAALYCLRREAFGELREYDRISPGWPISYADMQPCSQKRSKCIGCTAPATWTRPNLRRARRIRIRPYPTASWAKRGYRTIFTTQQPSGKLWPRVR
jgi:hypothetical protein